MFENTVPILKLLDGKSDTTNLVKCVVEIKGHHVERLGYCIAMVETVTCALRTAITMTVEVDN